MKSEQQSDRRLVIGIDAGNTRGGGGLTYLTEMVRGAEPESLGIDRVVVWGNSTTLAQLPDRAWLKRIHEPAHDGPFYKGFQWQARKLGASAAAENCDLLFFPGSTYLGDFSPFVAVSQNMLPFSPIERARFGWTWTRARLKLLQYAQAQTFRRATGMIFLTQWAKLGIESYLHSNYRRAKIVPHGISERFRRVAVPQLRFSAFSKENPFRWLYVSIVAPYKHQWNVAHAVARLRAQGIPVTVDFVGPAYAPSARVLNETIKQLDPVGEFLRYRGAASYQELHNYYHGADGFIFATTCENLPNILIEAMSAGLPIASSRFGPMPEVLGDGGLYFSPEDIGETSEVLLRLVRDPELRRRCAERAVMRASVYSWARCGRETFSFLGDIARQHREKI
jgi:glycosyltransferase involved in cell wall biosynthesis